MNRKSSDNQDFEFEKQRLAILESANKKLKNKRKIVDKIGKKQAWEYEIEAYRNERRKEKLYLFGSICGIVSLVLTLLFNFQTIINVFR